MIPPLPTLEIGYIARAHALTGELGLRTYDPASTVMDVVDRLLLRLKAGGEQIFVVTSVRETPKEVLVCLEGVNSRTAAEALIGSKVLIFREDIEEPGEGEFFQGDLIGLTAVDEAGAVLGTVAELWETGPVPNLVIKAEGRDELVIPFADEFIPSVDVPGGRIVVRPPRFLE